VFSGRPVTSGDDGARGLSCWVPCDDGLEGVPVLPSALVGRRDDDELLGVWGSMGPPFRSGW